MARRGGRKWGMLTAVQQTRSASQVTPSQTGRAIRAMLALTAVVDAVVVGTAAVLAWNLHHLDDVWSTLTPESPSHLVSVSWPLIVLLWMVVLAAKGAYGVRDFGAGPEEFRTVATASMVTAGLVGLLCYLSHQPLSRGFVLLTFGLGTPALLVERYLIRQLSRRARQDGRLTHRVIAVGGPSDVREVVDALRRDRHVGYQVVGACVPETVDTDRFPVPVLGRPSDARQLCAQVGADTVLVARGGYASSQELRRIAWDLEGSDIDLVVVPSLTDVAGPRIHMRPVGGLPLLHVEQPQAGAAGGLTKRLFDIVSAGIALLVLSPLFLVVAAIVKLHDGGPVFFRQRRVGRRGQEFGMLKFRSMVVDAEERLADLLERNELDGVLFKIRSDPRITPLGRWLRRFSVDELPQLFNVLRGEMSLVGPRPPLPAEVDRYARDVHRRLLVRPGLTGLWQVSGRSGLSWDESVRLDLYYVDNWSMMTDLVIIAKTVRAVLRADGAF
jgi:exopolysaccharide biosynthesis polyprenyl glycosylphosphotransferase